MDSLRQREPGAAVPPVKRLALMIMLLAALALSTHAPAFGAALSLCKPVLARKAGGEIATIDVDSSRRVRGETSIRGRLTAFLGQGRPGPGEASTHHLIRADLTFRCRIARGRVRQASVSPLSANPN